MTGKPYLYFLTFSFSRLEIFLVTAAGVDLPNLTISRLFIYQATTIKLPFLESDKWQRFLFPFVGNKQNSL